MCIICSLFIISSSNMEHLNFNYVVYLYKCINIFKLTCFSSTLFLIISDSVSRRCFCCSLCIIIGIFFWNNKTSQACIVLSRLAEQHRLSIFIFLQVIRYSINEYGLMA